MNDGTQLDESCGIYKMQEKVTTKRSKPKLLTIVELDLGKNYDGDVAREILALGSRFWFRSGVRGWIGALAGALIWLIFDKTYPAIEELGFNVVGMDIPYTVKTAIIFMMVAVCTALMTVGRFYSQQAKLGSGKLTGAQEVMTSILVGGVGIKDARAEGIKILRFAIFALLLHCSRIQYRVKGGEKNCWDRILARFSVYCHKTGVLAAVTSSGGLFRLTDARGILNMVVRFGIRPGLMKMAFIYFGTFLVLAILDLMGIRSVVGLYGGMALVSVITGLMSMMITVARNDANALLELSGDSSYGLNAREDRFGTKFAEQHRQADADHKDYQVPGLETEMT